MEGGLVIAAIEIQEGCFTHDSGTCAEASGFSCSRGPQEQERHAQMCDVFEMPLAQGAWMGHVLQPMWISSLELKTKLLNKCPPFPSLRVYS